MTFDVAFAIAILPKMFAAALITVQVTALAFAIALIGGLILALGRMRGPRVTRAAIGLMLEFTRSTPILVQVFFLYFVMPQFGLRLGAFATGVLAIALHYSAYLAEVYRAGIEGIPGGQWDAGRALGLKTASIYRLIILPQVVPPMIPAFGNYLILMIKDTPLLAAISVLELMQTAKAIGSETFRYLEPFTIVAAFFFVLSFAGAYAIRKAEQRFQHWMVR